VKKVVICLCALAVSASLFARGGWADPPGGWLYVYEANEGEDAHMPNFWEVGCLDGEWHRSSSSDQWDGSKPDEVGGAPGGVEAILLPGEGEDPGTDAWVLSIEDTGDPRNFTPNFPDPGSNRKMFLARDITGELNLADGITMCARLRLNPEPVDPFMQCPSCPGQGNGMDLHDQNKGMLGFAEQGVATVAMAIDDLGQLLLLDDADSDGETNPPATPIALPSTVEWLTVWLTAQHDAGTTTVSLYLNGSDTAEPDYDETPFTGVRADYEGGAADVGITAYMLVAAGSTGRDVAWQLDYVCVAPGFLEPEPANLTCPGGLTCSTTEDDVELTWSNRGLTITSFTIERDGTAIETGLPGTTESYTDADLGPGSYSYAVIPTVPGETCDPMTCEATLCPGDLACSVAGQEVTLTWTSGGPFQTVIKRDGAEVATVPAGETTWSETVAAGDYAYTVNAVGGAGGCDDLTCSVTILPPVPAETADYGPPAGGWGYEYDPTPTSRPDQLLLYNPNDASLGCLDDSWSRHNGSDRWDGSTPGDVDTSTDADLNGELDGAAPGGVDLGVVAGGAPGGGADAGVLSFEDVGNPNAGAFQWDGMAAQWADAVDPAIDFSGSNRKIFLGHNFNDLAPDPVLFEPLIDTGVTLNCRLRLTPEDQVVDFAQAGLTAPDGLGPQGNGKGLITLWYIATAADVDPTRKLPIYLWQELDGTFWLQVGNGEDDDVIRAYLGNTSEEGTQFVNLWITVERPDEFELIHTVTLYLNGSTEPYASKDVLLDQGDSEDESGEGNVITMGTMSTDEVVAMQVDFLRIAAGVNIPGGEPPPTGFRRGDSNRDGGVNIADAVYILQRLFAGGDPILCLDAADSNDDDGVNIADAVYILQRLFAGGDPIPAPGPDACGPDTTLQPGKQDLGCEDYPPDKCP
jgi:hypothetical protein